MPSGVEELLADDTFVRLARDRLDQHTEHAVAHVAVADTRPPTCDDRLRPIRRPRSTTSHPPEEERRPRAGGTRRVTEQITQRHRRSVRVVLPSMPRCSTSGEPTGSSSVRSPFSTSRSAVIAVIVFEMLAMRKRSVVDDFAGAGDSLDRRLLRARSAPSIITATDAAVFAGIRRLDRFSSNPAQPDVLAPRCPHRRRASSHRHRHREVGLDRRHKMSSDSPPG